NYVILRSPATLPTSQWKHVAATLEGSSGTLRLFIDGAMVAQTITAIRPLYELDPNYGPGLGIGGHSGDYGFFPFNGMIDEISLYSRALSPAEIQAIYGAGSGGKCVAPSAPFIINQPANQTVTVGGTATFSVLAGGTAPLTYQWTFQGTNLDGA